MSPGMIRMKMENEANKILSYMNDLEGENADEKEEVIHRKVRKVHKYPCPVSNVISNLRIMSMLHRFIIISNNNKEVLTLHTFFKSLAILKISKF